MSKIKLEETKLYYHLITYLLPLNRKVFDLELITFITNNIEYTIYFNGDVNSSIGDEWRINIRKDYYETKTI